MNRRVDRENKEWEKRNAKKWYPGEGWAKGSFEVLDSKKEDGVSDEFIKTLETVMETHDETLKRLED